MEPVKPAVKGKHYRSLHGPTKGEEGICVKAWETGFGHKLLKLKTPTGVHGMRITDVERIKGKEKKKKS